MVHGGRGVVAAAVDNAASHCSSLGVVHETAPAGCIRRLVAVHRISRLKGRSGGFEDTLEQIHLGIRVPKQTPNCWIRESQGALARV